MVVFGALHCVVVLALVGMYQILKPRLPQYTLRIRTVFPTFLKNATLAYQMGSDVQMHNHNFVSIHIHALTFDLFYPDWNNRLHHVGQVTDARQQEDPEEDFDSPIWVLPPRQDFQTLDNVIMIPKGGASVMSSLSWDLLQNRAILQVPLSGIIHVKANGKIPVTMGMICDNLVDVWNMEVQGLSCTIDSVKPGWSDMAEAGEHLRSKLEDSLWVPCDHPGQNDFVDNESCALDAFIESIQRRVEWKDAIPVLAL